MKYQEFIARKSHLADDGGFGPLWIPDFLFPFQRALVEWAIQKGRAAVWADCGLGKTPMELVWSENMHRHTGGRGLIVTPIAVGHQTIAEGVKFGVECHRSIDGKPAGVHTVTNYERLHLFDPSDYQWVVFDESSILKNFDGVTKATATQFARKIPYRWLGTATAAPNDYIELGTSSEALGVMGYTDMLQRYFVNDQNTVKPQVYRHRGMDFTKLEERAKWRMKAYADRAFWRWVASWARALRKPSDLGFEDNGFILPQLREVEHIVDASKPFDGELFPREAYTLQEQRQERRMTLQERCEMVASLANATTEPFVVWCHLNDEGDLLERLIPDAIQVSGKDSDDRKEDLLTRFTTGQERVLITKPRIGAFGLNWQHCANVSFFPSHSFEQYYQGVRRCWRFGQTKPVTVHVITTKGESRVLANLQRKSAAADEMFRNLVAHMNDALCVSSTNRFTNQQEVPSWLSSTNA